MRQDFDLPDRFTITAHSGCEHTPDNTILSIERAFESGADVTEIDLSFNKDGVPVLSHDKPKGGEPTLAEAFRKLADCAPMQMNIDVKSTDNLTEVRRLAEESGVLDRVFYTGVSEEFLDAVRTQTPMIPYYLNADLPVPEKQTDEFLQELIRTVRCAGAIGINAHHGNVSSRLVGTAHKNGLLFSIWTVDHKSDMLRVLGFAPDNITTRKPSALRQLIEE